MFRNNNQYQNNQGNYGGNPQGRSSMGRGSNPTTLIAIVGIVLLIILTRTGAISSDIIKYIIAGVIIFIIVAPMFTSSKRKGQQGSSNGNQYGQGRGYNDNNNRYY